MKLDKLALEKHVAKIKLSKDAKDHHKRAPLTFEEFVGGLHHLQLSRTGITQIDSAALLPCLGLEVLHLSDNKIEDLSFPPAPLQPYHPPVLPKLHTLTLQGNRLTSCRGLSSLVGLRKLYLDGNHIQHVCGLEGMTALEELHLDRQRLERGQGLTFDPASLRPLSFSLRHLSCAGNGLSDAAAQPLAALRGLSFLDVSDNEMVLPESLSDFVLPQMSSLRTLRVAGNAICRDVKHREKLILANDNLDSIDGKEVTMQERQFLLRFQIHKIKAEALARAKAEGAGAKHDEGLGVSGRSLVQHPSYPEYSNLDNLDREASRLSIGTDGHSVAGVYTPVLGGLGAAGGGSISPSLGPGLLPAQMAGGAGRYGGSPAMQAGGRKQGAGRAQSNQFSTMFA